MIQTKEKKAAFEVVGFAKKMSTQNQMENYVEIAAMWETLTPNMMSKLLSTSNGLINGFLGLSDEVGQELFTYLIGVTSDETDLEDVSRVSYPESDWLIFSCSGSIPGGSMINLKKEVLLEWLPNSDYTQLSLPRLEVYFEGDMTSDSYQSELWIPIKIKEASTNQGGEYDSI